MSMINDDAQLSIRALFGAHAIHAPAHLIVQYQGEQDGHAFCSVVGIIGTDLRSPETRARDFQHEFICGDMVLRPHMRYTDDDHRGLGLSGLATGGSLYPQSWRYSVDPASGVLVPNAPYDPACQ